MNSLYMFEILQIQGNTLQLRVEIHQSNCKYLPKNNPNNKNFVLQALMDFYESCKYGRLYNTLGERPVLTAQALRQKAVTSKYAARFDQWFACLYGRECPISAEQYTEYLQSPTAFERKYSVKTSGARTNNKGGYFYYTELDESVVVDAAESLITGIELLRRAPKKQTRAPFNWAEIECEVSDAELLAHLVVGAKWGAEIYPLALQTRYKRAA